MAKKHKKVPVRTRAPKGRGTIFPDARRGGFVGRVPIGQYANKRTRYAEVRAPTRAAVAERMNALEPPGPKTTVREWAQRWLEGLTNRPSTCAVYAHSINTHIVPELGHFRIGELTVSRVKAAAAKWKSLAPQTINLTLDRGATMFAAAIQDGLANANPFALCPRREYQRKPIDPFPATELKAIIGAWHTGACGPLFAFLAFSGCREGEAAALDVGDYDPTTGAIAITKTYSPRHGIGPPKSRAGARTLEIPTTAPGVREAVAHAIGTRKKGPLFATASERRIDHSQIYLAFEKLLTKLGLRKRSPHKMRHGVATALVSDGMPIGDVAKWMGDTPEMIMRTYVHPAGSDVAAALGRILGS